MRIPPSSIAILPVSRGQSNKPEKSENLPAQGVQKTAPPGLERALSHLQSLPAPNAGQANATDRISRNLARYAETQAIGTPPALPPAAPTPVVDSLETSPINTSASTPTPEANAPGAAQNSAIETAT